MRSELIDSWCAPDAPQINNMARLLQIVKENIGMAQATEDLAEVKQAKDVWLCTMQRSIHIAVCVVHVHRR